VTVTSLGIVGRLLKPNASTDGLDAIGIGGGDCIANTEAGFGGLAGSVGSLVVT